jgi:hypothetical protein
MMGLISIFKVIFGFLFVCLLGGLFFYTIFDLKPWRKDSQMWDPVNGPGPVILKYQKIAQQEFFNRTTWHHIKSYYAYYGLALILLALVMGI